MKKKNDVFLNPYSFTALFYIIPAAIKGTIHSAKLDKIYIILKADPRTFLLTTRGMEATITLAQKEKPIPIISKPQTAAGSA